MSQIPFDVLLAIAQPELPEWSAWLRVCRQWHTELQRCGARHVRAVLTCRCGRKDQSKSASTRDTPRVPPRGLVAFQPHHLDLTQYGCTNWHCFTAFDARQFPQLRHLVFGWQASCKRLVSLGALTSLRSLSLASGNVDVLHQLPELPQLRTLELDFAFFGSPRDTSVDALSSLSELRALTLRNVCDQTQLILQVRPLPHLRRLHVSMMTYAEQARLMQELARCPRLRDVTFHVTNKRNSTALELAVQSLPEGVRTLTLRAEACDLACVRCLCQLEVLILDLGPNVQGLEVLQVLPSLRVLHLVRPVAGLSSVARLRGLHMPQNDLGSAAAAPLVSTERCQQGRKGFRFVWQGEPGDEAAGGRRESSC